MSYDRKRSGRKFPTEAKKNSIYQDYEEDDDDQGYRKLSKLRDQPKSPFKAKRGSEIM